MTARAPRRLARARALAAVAVLAASLAALAHGTGALDAQELDAVDTRFELRGPEPPRDVIVVAIDAATFSELELVWPFPRSLHARVIESLAAAGARAIAYDVQFTERRDEREDRALLRAAAVAGNVVFSTDQVDRLGRTNVLGGDATVRAVGARAGHAALPPDDGGVLRRLPHATGGLESFAIATVEEADGRQVPPAALGGETAWIDYLGPTGTVPSVSFSAVLDGRVPPSRFRDRIVVVGATAPSLQDVHATSSSGAGEMPGAEIQAGAISTVRRGFPLREASTWLDLALIAVMAGIPALAARHLRSLPAALAIAAAAGGYAGAAQLAFGAGLILPVASPLAALGASAVGAAGVGYLGSALERERVRDAFRRFVPEAVVDEVLQQERAGVRLGGTRREATVLFSDLRGFTGFSEGLEPDQVIEVLNRYLTTMSDVILDHGGTLVSYMGDGIMAVFGAPVEQDDHADRAIAAARAMLGRLESFNAWLRAEGLGDGFGIGIGLNSGPVMSGHVGSPRRLEYTVLGDTTNTAARIEELTKVAGHATLIADATRRSARRETALVDVGEFPVRGRRAPVHVHAPAEPAPGVPQPPGDRLPAAG